MKSLTLYTVGREGEKVTTKIWEVGVAIEFGFIFCFHKRIILTMSFLFGCDKIEHRNRTRTIAT
jgi:hypothetical protein